MKLQNFLIIGGGTLILGLTGLAIGGKLLYDRMPDPPPPPEPVAAAPDPVAPSPDPEPVEQAASEIWPEPDNAWQEVVFAAFADDLGTNKKKDVTSGEAYKVNLYQDDGHETANRAKVDLDRDDKWDQKYTLKEDGSVHLQISSNDDENYDKKQLWDKEVELPDGVETPEEALKASAEQVTADGPAKRPADEVALSYVGKDLGTKKLKDVTKGKPFKVNVYQDDGNATANRAKIDLDRDDKWDEKLTFKDAHVSRKVAPNDDEDYTERYVWDDAAGWIPE